MGGGMNKEKLLEANIQRYKDLGKTEEWIKGYIRKWHDTGKQHAEYVKKVQQQHEVKI